MNLFVCPSDCRTIQNKDICILFTMYNTAQRQDMTDIVLHYYIECLRFPINNIFIVDSANRGVRQLPKSQQVIFDQDEICEYKSNSSTLEMCSLKQAALHLPQIASKAYIFKLTCKYKLPELGDIYPSKPLIIQHLENPARNWQNTELWGVRGDLFSEFVHDLNWNESAETNLMEHRFWKVIQKYDYQRFPPMKNIAKFKRGIGDILTEL